MTTGNPDRETALTPAEVVAHLDRYIVGQAAAKRAVAIALRNRWRRKMAPPELADDITPKNIILIGPTGVGKTEIARRLAKLAALPFLKIEASKFTEVGYVGRDVDSMIRDLMETGVALVRREYEERVRAKAREAAEDKVLDLVMHHKAPGFEEAGETPETTMRRRQKLREQLRAGLLDGRDVTIQIQDKGFMPIFEVFGQQGMEEMGINLRNQLGQMFPPKRKDRHVKPSEAVRLLEVEEAARLVDNDKVVEDARSRVEQSGIIFLDEIDKVAGRETGHGPDVSREGVQRDLLPIVEGTTVSTKYGPVRTDHILFIASGAFHVSKPSDLIPELQGRFPIRVELSALGAEDFKRILVEPENSLVRQYTALLATENVALEIRPDAVEAIAELTVKANAQTENIGARRLYTLLEKLLEDLSFDAPKLTGQRVVISKNEVYSKLRPIIESEDMSRYVL